MATAEELLATYSNTGEVFKIDLNNRTIVTPETFTILGVEADDDVKRLHFIMPRYYGEFDLSEFDIRINYITAGGKEDLYPVEDAVTSNSGSTIAFTWLVDRNAFDSSGTVELNVCLKKYNDEGVIVKELNTTTIELRVLPGLETSRAVVENHPSAYDALLFRLHAVEAATGNGQDGYYSIAKVTDTDNGYTISIINQDGTFEANLRDGYTPVRGTDYWTEEDKTAMKSDLKTYVDAWAPVMATVTLSTSSWVDNTQTATVDGVKIDSLVLAGPEPSDANYEAYVDCGVRCISQNEGSLTFRCETVPAIDLNVNVSVYFSST